MTGRLLIKIQEIRLFDMEKILYYNRNHRERICQDDFFNFSKLNKPAEKKSS